MNADGDITRTVRSWLRADQYESATRIVDDVLASLDATPQRRSWWPPWRLPGRWVIGRSAIPITAVVVIALVAINIAPARHEVRGGLPVVSPSPSPTAEPTAAPTQEPTLVPHIVPLDAGHHSLVFDGVPLSFDLVTDNPEGDGWAKFRDLYISKSVVGPQTAEAMLLVTTFPDGVVAHSCAILRDPPVGPSVADLATAVARAPGTKLVTGPTDTLVGGRVAKHVVVTVRQLVGCDPGFFYGWLDEGGGPWWPYALVGDTINVWIVDVDGTRVFVATETHAPTGAAEARVIKQLEAEVEAIVRSIRFE